MAAEDLARALIRLDNPYLRRELLLGEFAGVDEYGFELSGEERELLRAAAREVPREDQFPVTLVGENRRPERPGEGGPGTGWGYWPPGAARAIEYIREHLRDPGVQANFVAWQDLRGDKFP